jgi:hypothetical protein
MKKTASSKKGQIWTIDYMIGMFIFIATLLAAIFLMRGLMNEKDTFKETARESEHIASILLSEQIPNSSFSNLSALKIAENNRVNITKLQAFDNISYAQKKTLFQNSGEFTFYFYNGTIINQTTCFRGYNFTIDNCTLQIPENAINIAKTERLVILNSQIVKLVVITWI